ncbi:MAG: rRNA maturation RNase YbeY [Prevotellaceae bacterium]|jgi:rRNA maturation RNase YbeY|nr:rRNA maturation RNase YbeY [Prevotellaceae bacterium]
MIYFFNEDMPFPFSVKKQPAKAQVKKLIEMENRKTGDLCFVFCSDDFLLEINKKHLGHDYYTDVVTFDYTVDDVVAGDIFISVERVKENAREYGASFNCELSRVIYHGLLHLCGYKDKSPDDERIMREKEDFYLNILSIIE